MTTPGDWLIGVAYLSAAVACVLLSGRGRLVGCVLALLGIAKVAGVQGLILDALRGLAHDAGWYDSRRGVQLLVIVAMTMAVGAVLAASAPCTPRWSTTSFRVPAALIVLLGFVAVRGASLHAVDAALASELWSLPLGQALELGGIAWVAWVVVAGRDRPCAWDRVIAGMGAEGASVGRIPLPALVGQR